MEQKTMAHYHLPGLFEHYEFYKAFLPLYRNHPEWFHSWCDIGSVYGAPSGIIWAGGRTEESAASIEDVFSLMKEYDIPVRITLSNSLLEKKHLPDSSCNLLMKKLQESKITAGIIIHSEMLLEYLKKEYPGFYYVSSTTKVLTRFEDFRKELDDENYSYAVMDFRLNKRFGDLSSLSALEKKKTEFLCNECCSISCMKREECYQNVSRIILGLETKDYECSSKEENHTYSFSRAMENPSFIGMEDIRNTYLPMGFSNFKIEGRGLGSAILLEFILHYMVKPECALKVREALYLDSMLDLF